MDYYLHALCVFMSVIAKYSLECLFSKPLTVLLSTTMYWCDDCPSGSANILQIKETLWPSTIIVFLLLLSPPHRTLGGAQKSCWTQLNTCATSASATWKSSPSLSLLQPILPLLSCHSTPISSTHPMSPCIPTRASPPLEHRSRSPRSNPCNMPHNF